VISTEYLYNYFIKKGTALWLLLPLFALVSPRLAPAQSLQIGSIQDEQIMIQSLLSDSLHIPTIQRPFLYDHYLEIMSDTTISSKSGWWNRPQRYTTYSMNGIIGETEIGLLPITLQNTMNSRFPMGENNEAAWYGRGMNSEISGGFFLKSDFFTITFQPHFIYQENLDFLTPRFVLNEPENGIIGTESFTYQIDYPFRFGAEPFSTFDLGYSSIRLHASYFEIGLASEPQWWGSAIRYPLMMSNNAPGFNHLFLGTREPVQIPKIGKVHIKWIMGYANESGYFNGVGQGERRFLNGVNISFNPNLLSNLTFGLNRMYHIFDTDGFRFQNVITLFDPFQRVSLVARQGADDVRQARNQIASVYFQLKLPAANGEIYGEFFREDHSYDLRDLFVQPNHNSAYSFGFRKLSYLPRFDFVIANLEFTNLTISQLQQVRPQGNFYTHTPIGQGHTNRGQLLGAAIGPGSNSQFFSLDFYKKNLTVGLFAQRHVINDSFHFRISSFTQSPFSNVGDFINHRINLNSGFHTTYSRGNLTLFSKFTWTKAFNYGRFNTARYITPDVFDQEHFDRTNVQFQIGFTFTP